MHHSLGALRNREAARKVASETAAPGGQSYLELRGKRISAQPHLMNNPRDPHVAERLAAVIPTDNGRLPQVPVVEILENGDPRAVVGTPPARDARQGGVFQ